ncbi:hypothetical protein Tco_0997031 [Tanacetum coccineum]
MVPATTSLTGFSGETRWPLGKLRLLVTIGDVDHSTKAWMNFMIVRSLSPYNGIIERSGIREIRAVPSTTHGMLKFSVDGGIVTIRSTILIPAECATKKRGQAPERSKAIQAEVQKLVEAGIMREVHYHDWLSNPVMVKKHEGSWRMCVDFRLKQGIWVGAGLDTNKLSEGRVFTYALRFLFKALTMRPEYEAVNSGLLITAQIVGTQSAPSVDSKLDMGYDVLIKENPLMRMEVADVVGGRGPNMDDSDVEYLRMGPFR